MYVELRPFASKWDKDAVFPLDAFRKLADLGFAGNMPCIALGGSPCIVLYSHSIV